ncbi:hypothetical protein H9P43_004169 [Blastocladiella emersonii ATCC 22665]|nr:hypothetical protein H9P43_004169 [Blastocladiella emersonii ATCC 22665]
MKTESDLMQPAPPSATNPAWPTCLEGGPSQVYTWSSALASVRDGRFPDSLSIQIVHIDALYAALLARHMALGYAQTNLDAILPEQYDPKDDAWLTEKAVCAAREGYGLHFTAMAEGQLLAAYGQIMRALHADRHWAAAVALLGLLPSAPTLAELCSAPVCVLDLPRCLADMYDFLTEVDKVLLTMTFSSPGPTRCRPRSLFRATDTTPARGMLAFDAATHGTIPRCLDRAVEEHGLQNAFSLMSNVTDWSKPHVTGVHLLTGARARGIEPRKCRVHGATGATKVTLFPENSDAFDRLGLNAVVGVASSSVNVSVSVRYTVTSPPSPPPKARGRPAATLHTGVFFLDDDPDHSHLCQWVFLPGHATPPNPECRPVVVPLPPHADDGDGYGVTPSPLCLRDMYGADAIGHVEIIDIADVTVEVTAEVTAEATAEPPNPDPPKYLESGPDHIKIWTSSVASVRNGRFPDSLSIQIVHIDVLYAALLAQHLALSYTRNNINVISVGSAVFDPNTGDYHACTVWVTDAAVRAAREGYGTHFTSMTGYEQLVAPLRFHPRSLYRATDTVPARNVLEFDAAAHGSIPRCLELALESHGVRPPRDEIESTEEDQQCPCVTCVDLLAGARSRGLEPVNCRIYGAAGTISVTMFPETKAAFDRLGVNVPMSFENSPASYDRLVAHPASYFVAVSMLVRYLVSSATTDGGQSSAGGRSSASLHAGVFFLVDDDDRGITYHWMFMPGHVSPDNPQCRPVLIPRSLLTGDGFGITPLPLVLCDMYGPGITHVEILHIVHEGRFPGSLSMQIVHIDALYAALLARHMAVGFAEANVEAINSMIGMYEPETDVWLTDGAVRAAREGYGVHFTSMAPQPLLTAYGQIMRAVHANQHWAAAISLLGLLPSAPALSEICSAPVCVLDLVSCLAEMHEFLADVDTALLTSKFGAAGTRFRPRALYRATETTPACGIFTFDAKVHGTVLRCLDAVVKGYDFEDSFSLLGAKVDWTKPHVTCVNVLDSARARGIAPVKCRINSAAGVTSVTLFPESQATFGRFGLSATEPIASDATHVAMAVRYTVTSGDGGASATTLHSGVFFLDHAEKQPGKHNDDDDGLKCKWMFLPGHVSPGNPQCRAVYAPLPDHVDDSHGTTPSPLVLREMYGDDVIGHIEVAELYFTTPPSYWEVVCHTD